MQGKDSGKSASTAENSRRSSVDRARQSWINRLIDLSQRNNLLYFRPLKVGTLDLTLADRDALADLLSGKNVALSKLLPTVDLVQITAQAKEIARKAKENAEERGLETLHLAAGMATWRGEEGKRPPEAAVLLVPMALEQRGRSGPALKRTGEPQVNPVLLHVLNANFRCVISAEALLAAADTDADRDDDPFDLDRLLAKLTELCAGVPMFEVRRRVILGNFSFQKMAMVRDLRELGQQFSDNDIIAGLSGVTEARARVTSNNSEPNPREFDRTPPQNEFLVLDTDSTQQKAIFMAQRGGSLVIQGPPGTGKSQVIANLIVVAAAAGKRVLFVAEKRAALQVVLDRLNRSALGYLALDLHGADTSRKVIAGRLREAIQNVERGAQIASDQVLQGFDARRARLNAHVQRLHQKRAPADMSVFELQTRLLRSPASAVCKARFRGAALMSLTQSAAAEAKDALDEAAAEHHLFLGTTKSPWLTASFTDGHAAQAAIDVAQHLADESWPNVKELISRVLWTVRPVLPANVEELLSVLRLCASVNQHLQLFKESLFTTNLPEIVVALRPASLGFLGRTWATIVSSRYRSSKRIVSGHALKPLTPQELLRCSVEARTMQEQWTTSAFASPVPVALVDADVALKTTEECARQLNEIALSLNRSDLCRLPLSDLEQLLSGLRDDATTAKKIPALRRVETKLTALGLKPIVDEIRRSQPPAETWSGGFERAWLMSCLEHAWAEEPDLAAFNGQVHGKHAAEFCHFDRQRLEFAGKLVARRHVEEAGKMLAGLSAQATTVRREAEKKMRHLPFRKLMETAPDVLAALFPCFMCSPLSVSQLLPGDKKLFDLVIFDEASQVLPEDAVASLVRANQVVVAGDEHQLPPTQFFAGGGDDGDEERDDDSAASDGFESLLKMMKAFVPAPMLEWHYRSRDERLIAFSNRHIYDNRLITFPGPGSTESAVRHELVTEGAGSIGATESDSAEVRRVVELVIRHAEQQLQRPEDRRLSLGVITLGITHARRVQALLDRELESRPELDPFFDSNLPERFFVKNLERVQGDERDAIILTLGIAPDKAGKASLTAFGPLNNREQGYRRLNVAITRARQLMTLVSCFTHHAIDVSKQVSRGIELMRGYLEFAISRGVLNDERGRTAVAPNAFEADIAEALEAIGIKTVPQWGASSYRIDLVAQHPKRPGRLVLAIECDGATYHSAPTARDRDRLRQQHLEALGWRFHRIWSTDWFTRRDEELKRADQAFAAAVALADRMDGVET